MASCSSDTSRLKIDSGTYITNANKNRVPAVFWLGMCTATAVSHNTIVFAAHCADSPTGPNGRVNEQICIQKNLANPDNSAAGKCASKVFIHPQYQGGTNYRVDVAVAVFPDYTFKNYFAIETTAPTMGAQVLMVGYSFGNSEKAGIGSKRWGYNQLQGLDADDAILSVFRNSTTGVAVSPGDSGGPLFNNCKVMGVASRMTETTPKMSLHTNLTVSANTSWMQTLARSEGAIFCGLNGMNPAVCKPSELGVWNEALRNSTQTEEFPCAPSSDGTPSTPDQSNQKLFLALGEGTENSFPLVIASSSPSTKSASICQGDSPCLNSQKLTASKFKNGTYFFETTSVITSGQILRADIFDNNNQLIDTRVIRFAKR